MLERQSLVEALKASRAEITETVARYSNSQGEAGVLSRVFNKVTSTARYPFLIESVNEAIKNKELGTWRDYLYACTIAELLAPSPSIFLKD